MAACAVSLCVDDGSCIRIMVKSSVRDVGSKCMVLLIYTSPYSVVCFGCICCVMNNM